MVSPKNDGFQSSTSDHDLNRQVLDRQVSLPICARVRHFEDAAFPCTRRKSSRIEECGTIRPSNPWIGLIPAGRYLGRIISAIVYGAEEGTIAISVKLLEINGLQDF
jgi:hypothetical protein